MKTPSDALVLPGFDGRYYMWSTYPSIISGIGGVSVYQENVQLDSDRRWGGWWDVVPSE